jgi:4-hydroxy-2-oxoheptanedioate aldolase
MRENTLKRKLKAGKAVFGVQIIFPSPPVVEMLGYLGFDWVLIDNEHGSITVDSSEEMIRAAELVGLAPVVRPVGNKPEIIAPFLDRGAWGIQVPHVNNAIEARSAVDAVKYYPNGHRGMAQVRPAEYGYASSLRTYFEEANRNTLVCLMLEEEEAINNLEEMVKVDGVDVFFIGAGDLSLSMGHPGQTDHPEVQAVVEKGIKIIRDSGGIVGASCLDSLVPRYLELGVRYFHTTVNGLLRRSSESYLKEMRDSAAAAGV